MNYSLTINGLDNAFPKEFGCDCPRCTRAERAANTSVSLIGLNNDQTAFHALIDCGHGINESLIANPLLAGPRARLDWILLTHWHSDHSIELGRICAAWMRTCARRRQSFQAIKTWCRESSAQWLAAEHGNAWRVFADPVIAPGFDDAGVVLAPVPLNLPDLTVTPITLHHSSADIAVAIAGEPTRRQPSCAGFVLQTAQRKTVLFWDMDTTNTWITHPQTEAHHAAIALAQDADLLCVDCNTWRYSLLSGGKSTGHASFQMHLDNARALRPRETLLMHLSGHEDAPGDGFGWLNDEWQTRAQAEWQSHGLPGTVRVPHIGECLPV